jgi:phosphoglycerate kinase
MARFKTLNDLDVKGRRVLLRADLNVPMRDGRLTDTTRIDRLAPSIDELAQKGGRIVLLSHFGRPKGKRVPELSLAPLAGPVSAALGGRSVVFAEDCVGPAAAALVETLGGGEVALLENLRFHPGEEANDPAFAQELAALGDLYVNDAFSAAHRAHASVEALARLLPAAAGRLMQAELEHLAKALEAPARPVAAIVGGAKISTKLDLLGNLVRRVDMLAIGGAMANTFLGALGVAVGRSLCEHDMAETARRIVAQAKAARCELVLPTDAQVAAALEAEVANRTVSIKQVPAEAMILDLGPASAGDLARRLGQFRTLVWNGPLGCFEVPPFDAGTNAVAQAAAEQTRAGRLLSVAGGGDTVAALSHAGVADDFSYVSTAGGAFLEWLEGKTLPGVAALEAAAAS